jgi:hypothetical protein
MSATRVTVRDRLRSVHGEVDEASVGHLVGALAADPETLAEYWTATTRFCHTQPRGQLCAAWRSGMAPRHGERDDDWLLLDLPGRWVPYHLSDAWMFAEWRSDWMELSEQRRKERWTRGGRDWRQVLYGRPMLEFLIRTSRQVHQQQRAARAAANGSRSCARTSAFSRYLPGPGGPPVRGHG